MRRHVKIALEAGAAGFALVALVAILVVLRLASGPLPLDAVAPYLAAALSNPATGVSVGIDHAFVALGEGPKAKVSEYHAYVMRAISRRAKTMFVV